jgi:hypothetical protein
VCTACTEAQQIFSRGTARKEAQCDEGVATDGIRVLVDGSLRGRVVVGGWRRKPICFEARDYSIYEKSKTQGLIISTK